MVAEYKKKANLYVGGAILGGILLAILSYGMGMKGGLGSVPNLLIAIPFFIGLYYYAKAKGYSGWLALLGFLHLLGLIILVLLPDKKKMP